MNTYDNKTLTRKLKEIENRQGKLKASIAEVWPHAMAYASGLHGNANTNYLSRLFLACKGLSVGGVSVATQIRAASQAVFPYLTFSKDGVKCKGYTEKMTDEERRTALDNISPLFTYEKPAKERASVKVKDAIKRLISRLDGDDLDDRELFHKLRALIGEDIKGTAADPVQQMQQAAA